MERRILPFGRAARHWRVPPASPPPSRAWYLRVWMQDKAGSMAEVSRVLAAQRISLQAVLQHPAPQPSAKSASAVPVIFVTHACTAAAVERARTQLLQRRLIARDSLFLPLFAESATAK